MSIDPKDLKRWVRLLTLPMACLPSRPERVEARVGRGLHLLLSSQAEGLVHLCFSPSGDTPQAARRTPTTALSLLGDRQPDEIQSPWVERVGEALTRLEGLDLEAWAAFLSWAADQPSVALPYSGQLVEQVSSGSQLLVRIVGRCNAA